MKKIKLLVKFIHSAEKELEISNEDYEKIKEEGISAIRPIYSEIDKLAVKAASKETNGYFDYKIEDADNNETILDWDRD